LRPFSTLRLLSSLTRRPPSSPLFPYTTLFRSSGADRHARSQQTAPNPRCRHRDRLEAVDLVRWRLWRQYHRHHGCGVGHADARRSEEHTSELQSPYDLVCRLLLEKKKKQKAAT